MSTATADDFRAVLSAHPSELALVWAPKHEAEALAAPCFTGRVDGRIAAMAGVLRPWPGLGSVWAIVTTTGLRHPVFVHRTVRRRLWHLAEALNLRRVEAHVQADFQRGVKWVEALGFTREATHPHYGPRGETFYTYAWFPKEPPK